MTRNSRYCISAEAPDSRREFTVLDQLGLVRRGDTGTDDGGCRRYFEITERGLAVKAYIAALVSAQIRN